MLFKLTGAWALHETCGCELSGGPTSTRRVHMTFGNQTVVRNELRYDEWGLLKYQTITVPGRVDAVDWRYLHDRGRYNTARR